MASYVNASIASAALPWHSRYHALPYPRPGHLCMVPNLRRAFHESLNFTSRKSTTPCVSSRKHSAQLMSRYPGEHNFNLSEYMVVLDKPIGLTLAPDPITGQIIVQNIKEGSPADKCQLIQIGDVVKMCSAVFGEDMWQAIDIRRIRWAINNRTTKIKLVLERGKGSDIGPTWYSKGKVGLATMERDSLQLPVAFTTASLDDWGQDLMPPGKTLFAGFHRSVMGVSQVQQRLGRASGMRLQRLQQLRGDLAAARLEPDIDLSAGYSRSAAPASSIHSTPGNHGSSSGASKANQHGGSAKQHQHPHQNQNHHKPLNPLGRILGSLGASGSSKNGSSSSGIGNGSNPKMPLRGQKKGKWVTPVLPWLLVTSGRLDTRDLTYIASIKGLGALLELGLMHSPGGYLAIRGSENSSDAEGTINGQSATGSMEPYIPTWGNGTGDNSCSSSTSSSSTSSSVGLPYCGSRRGPEPRIRSLANAAAALHRLTHRRHGSLHHSRPEQCCVLLHCEAHMDSEVAGLLAAWLHWYCGMPLQEACLSAEMSLGCCISQGLIEEATEYLVNAAEERASRVVITWKYGGLQAYLAGDLVGGWHIRVPMLRCKNPLGCPGDTQRGHFFIELPGLRPGVYAFKYIVDGTWTIDPEAPKAVDDMGNYNNVVQVHDRPPVITSKERLDLARWHAALMAFETKLGLPLAC